MKKLCTKNESGLTLKQVAWSDPSSSGTSLRIAWISSGAHLALIALTSLADIIQVMLFSVSGKASYLNVGSGLSGANPRNEPGTLSTTRWWYESLKKKIQFFVVFKQKVWSRIRKRRFEAKREKELGAEEQKKKRPKHIFLVSKEIERDSKNKKTKKKSNSESFNL